MPGANRTEADVPGDSVVSAAGLSRLWVITRPRLQRSDVSFRQVRTSLRCSRVSYQRVFRAPDAARRSSPWRGASTRQPRRLLPPVRPGVGTDDSAAGAHHARAERWHCHVIWPRVGAQDRTVVALPSAHVERPHAVGAHVAERHWRTGLGSVVDRKLPSLRTGFGVSD
jgi:hypothetical protein